jgi:hypothetical protein
MVLGVIVAVIFRKNTDKYAIVSENYTFPKRVIKICLPGELNLWYA